MENSMPLSTSLYVLNVVDDIGTLFADEGVIDDVVDDFGPDMAADVIVVPVVMNVVIVDACDVARIDLPTFDKSPPGAISRFKLFV